MFCKAPEPGSVKTRLAESIGIDLATELHREFSLHCIAMLSRARLAPVTLMCWPGVDHPFFQSCREAYGVELYPQAEGNLGMKMLKGFEAGLQTAKYALVLGTDCLVMEETVLQEALQSLIAGADGVVVPADDGGYVLLGLSTIKEELFDAMPWGESHLMEATRKVMSGQWVELPPLWDVDRQDDLLRLANNRHAMNLSAELEKLLAQVE